MAEKPESKPLGELTAYERWELPNLENPNDLKKSRSSMNAAAIKPLTADDIENIRQQAYDAGFEEGKTEGHEQGRLAGLELGRQAGHQEGLEQGLLAGQAQIDEQMAKLEQLMAGLVDPLYEQQKLVEQGVLNVALALARSVIHRELKLDSSSIKTAVMHIFKKLPKLEHGLTLSINPSDKKYIQAVLEANNKEIDVLTDDSITEGGCIVETSSQFIDYTIEKRFQKAVHAMLLDALQTEKNLPQMEASSTIKELSDYPADLLNEEDNHLPNDKKNEAGNNPYSGSANADDEQARPLKEHITKQTQGAEASEPDKGAQDD